MGDFEMTCYCVILKYSADPVNPGEQGTCMNIWGGQFLILSIKGLV